MRILKYIAPQPEPAYTNSYIFSRKIKEVEGSLNWKEKLAHFLPLVITGASATIVDGFNYMRAAGATAREMLIKAAADKWQVEVVDCYAENAHVINRKNGKRLAYGELAEAAAKVRLLVVPQLKEKKDWKIVGKSIDRFDIPEKVTGEAQFGLDTRIAEMLYGVIRHATYHDGAIKAITNQSEIESKEGVKKVILLPQGKAAVVVATTTWHAQNAALALEFDEVGDATISNEKIIQQAKRILDNDEMIATPLKKGNAAAVLDQADKVIEAEYEIPFLAHACMEPMNATVLVKDGKAEIWVGHQSSSIAKEGVAKGSGIKMSNITVHSLYLGGGFGRRTEIDFPFNAAYVAKQLEGTPIQLVYTREQDMRYEMYRPYATCRFRAKLDKDGSIEAWENKLVTKSVARDSRLRVQPLSAMNAEDDHTTPEGAADILYNMTHATMAFGQLETPIQVGNWRSVGSSYNVFFVESFIDECAHSIGKDPYLYRKGLITQHPRFLAILEKLAEISDWTSPLSKDKFRGLAIQKSHGTMVGQVAEITKIDEKQFHINKYYCVIDCGTVIHPDTVKAQMESSIIFGLTAALYGEITFKDGEVEQYNFPQYEMIRMNLAPNMEIHIMDSDAYPGGVGEPGTPPVAPALTNAIFAATGERIRSLPLQKHGFTFV